ncbi:MAG: TonB-dependent receptor family protein, partial [Fidelibacterota bacterium]
EVSNETYLGLADPDFGLHPYMRYRASQLDRITAQHSQIQFSHAVTVSRSFDVTSTVYRNGFRRNWYKLDRVAGQTIGSILEDPETFNREFALLTARDSEPGVYGIKANNRSYGSFGFQSVGRLKSAFGPLYHRVSVGWRIHRDYEDRFQWVDAYGMAGGTLILTGEGEPGSDANRRSSAQATALFLLDQVTFKNFLVTFGLRSESIHYTRIDWGPDDLERATSGNPERTVVTVLLPGMGLHYRVNASLRVFGGLHKGFSPPGPRKGEERYRAEESVNLELGARYRSGPTQLQLLGFFNRHYNLLGADLLAVGGEGSGDLYNGGEVWIHGLEVLTETRTDVGRRVEIPVSFSYTYTRGEFKTSFQSDYGPWGTVKAGYQLPYLPGHQLYLNVGMELSRWTTSFGARYTGAMRSRAGRGEVSRRERIDGHLVLDISSRYSINGSVRMVFNVLNATNRTYIAARRPAGVRPGLPRTVLAGIQVDL